MLLPNLSALTGSPLLNDEARKVVHTSQEAATKPLIVETVVRLLRNGEKSDLAANTPAPYWLVEVTPKIDQIVTAWERNEFGDEYISNSRRIINAACMAFSDWLTDLIKEKLQTQSYSSYKYTENQMVITPTGIGENIELVASLLGQWDSLILSNFTQIYFDELEAARALLPADRQPYAVLGGPWPQYIWMPEFTIESRNDANNELFNFKFRYSTELRVYNEALVRGLLMHQDAGQPGWSGQSNDASQSKKPKTDGPFPG